MRAITLLSAFWLAAPLWAEPAPLVVRNGVLREARSGTPRPLFGTTYSPAFGLPYDNLQRSGRSPQELIDADLDDLARLHLDVIRVLVDDAELMGPDGALDENAHLGLLDYLIAAAGLRGLYVVLTPVSFARGLDPVRVDGRAVSLRARYASLDRLVTDAAGRELQTRYLTAFAAHVNRYTQRAYAAEPAVVLFEPIAQPRLGAGVADAAWTAYLDQMVDALRAGGARQPIVVSAAGRPAATVAASVDGVTVSVYPNGVEAGRAVRGDVLGRLASDFGLGRAEYRRKLKVCLEFDVADSLVGAGYPALALALRAAGVQVACQFQYDGIADAALNNTWPSHYLSVLATPGRALALSAAGEVFRATPAGGPPPRFPADLRRDPLRVESDPDCVRWCSDARVVYSDSVSDLPSTGGLGSLVGRGSSPLVRYDGLGAYALERFEGGAWRLTLYPDPLLVGNPFDLARWRRGGELVPVAWFRPLDHRLALALPGLGGGWWLWPVRERGLGEPTAGAGGLRVPPGTYLLTADRTPPHLPAGMRSTLLGLGSDGPPLLAATFPSRLRPDRPAVLSARAAGGPDLRVTLHARDAAGHEQTLNAEVAASEAESTRSVAARAELFATWRVVLPAEWLGARAVAVWWEARDSRGARTVPADGAFEPALVPVGEDLPVTLVDYRGGFERAVVLLDAPSGRLDAQPFGGAEPGRFALKVETIDLGRAGRWLCRTPVDLSDTDLTGLNAVRLRAWARPAPGWLELGLVEEDGSWWATTAQLGGEWTTVTVPLSSFDYRSGGRARPAPNPSRLAAVVLQSGPRWQTVDPEARRTFVIDDLALVRSGR